MCSQARAKDQHQAGASLHARPDGGRVHGGDLPVQDENVRLGRLRGKMHLPVQSQCGAYASILAGIVDIQRLAGGPGREGWKGQTNEHEKQD